MQTSTKYKQNLNKRIITEEMLSDALYSANKNAKSRRDRIEEIKYEAWINNYHKYVGKNIYTCRNAMKSYYEKKSIMLSLLKPIEIHIQKLEHKTLYFLLYECGGRTFHSPISKSEAKQYDLPVVELINFETHSAERTTLASNDFVNKVVKLIESEDYTYVPNEAA